MKRRSARSLDADLFARRQLVGQYWLVAPVAEARAWAGIGSLERWMAAGRARARLGVMAAGGR